MQEAEPGQTTTEWKAVISAAIANTVGLAVAFGAPINSAQQGAILAWTASVTALAGLYAVSRGIRKNGTAG